ncbi:hypothetical protein HPB50_000484 [Hyalomma asiaticum]|uniref:Uncharacterized protein n=1 Tax=Hyalomma asiaticum TaxID=266040 RepID=A0ACB7SS46_HYAAI|nr:hypothetical protein HPB50_000484 [Hyalomma asiaticum]
MPILYTDGSSSADAEGAASSGPSTSQHRDDRSDKKRRKKSAIGRFGRAVVKSFKSSDKNCSRHKDVELANEKLRQINRETSKDVLRYHDVSPVATRHPHGITMVAGVRTRTYTEAKSLPEETGSLGMPTQHSETAGRVNVAVLRQEVEESFAIIEAESPVPSSSVSTANLSISAEDVTSLNTQPLPPSAGPAVLECGQMQEIKIHKSAGGDDCSQQRSVSKNTTLSDLRTASVAAAASAEFCAQVARQLKDASVQTDMTLMPEVPPEQPHKNSRFWEALRNIFSALRDFFLCAALAHKEAAASE